MDATEWTALMQTAGMLDASFTAREARLCFSSSRMWVSDVVKGYHQSKLLGPTDFMEVCVVFKLAPLSACLRA